MEVNGSTQTLHSPRTNLSAELFDTLARVREIQTDLRADAKEDTNRRVEQEKPRLDLEQVQKMVLRPSEVPLEERLSQVISLEDIQRLLLLRGPMGGDQALRGNIVDRMA